MIRVLPIFLLVTLALALWSSGMVQEISLARVLDARDALHALISEKPFLALSAFYLAYVAMAAMAFPVSPLLSLSAGFLFGPLTGALVSVAGATSGGAILFLAAHTGLSAFFHARLGARLRSFAAGFRDDAAAYMLFLRVAIIFPSWFVNIGTGLIGIPLKTFLWTTALGIAPVTLAFAFAGSGLERVLSAELAAWRACNAQSASPCAFEVHPLAVLQPELIAALLVLAALALVSVLLRRRWLGVR